MALIAAGLVLMLVAAGGRLPSRLRYGDNEASWEAVEEFVENVVEDVSPNQAPQLLRALDDLAKNAPEVAAAGATIVMRGKAYEDLITEMISNALAELRVSDAVTVYSWPDPTLRRINFDIGIEYLGKLLLADIRWRTNPLATSVVADAITRSRYAQSVWRPDGSQDLDVSLLLVSNARPSQDAQALIRWAQSDAKEHRARVQLAMVHGPEDQEVLTQAVRIGLSLEDGGAVAQDGSP